MPTTSNFGWTTPADTDLVKDGAAAIRTLGNGVDTSFVDLKGGTTGQILSKASNADLDFSWSAAAAGDITEVQAGVGISIASGTGPIPVITNSSTDLITTAGDLLYGTAADTVARLGIGTAGQVLKVNSGATAPEWGAAGSAFVGVQVFNSAAQSVANSTDYYPTFDSESWDTNTFHSTVTNTERLTVPSGQGGKYFVYAVGGYTGNTTGFRRFTISINRTSELFNNFITPDTGSCVITFSGVVELVATDYVEVLTGQTSGGALNYLGGAGYSSFGMYKIG